MKRASESAEGTHLVDTVNAACTYSQRNKCIFKDIIFLKKKTFSQSSV